MIVNIISVLILIALVALFGWLASRAWRSRWKVLKWGGAAVSGLLSLIFIIITVVALIGFYRLNVAPYSYSVANVMVANTPEQLARGEKLARLCAGCHSTTLDLPLDGSKGNFLADGPPAGVISPPNLTPGGRLKDWSDGEIIRAIREGVNKDGQPLVIMPSAGFRNMSDTDVQALVAYLRSQPAIQRETPLRNMNLIAALFIGSGMFPTSAQVPITQPLTAPAAGTVEYGKYLTSLANCQECHGHDLTGASVAGGPPSPNLAAIVPTWTEEEFIQTIRTGVDPAGHTLNPKEMPWEEFSRAFDDSELKDLYSYLASLEPTSQAAR